MALHGRIEAWASRGALCASVALLVGCGGDMVPASGRVEHVDGSPIEGGIRVIRFEPTEDTNAKVRKAASGQIESDGTFSLMTIKPGDGVYKGKYIVTFTAIKDRVSGESLIPQKYSSFAESPFEVTVDGPKDDYLFQLEKL